MKVGDLVRSIASSARHAQWFGLVMEEEEFEGEVGTWVWYPDDDGSWTWYSFDERDMVEIISANG